MKKYDLIIVTQEPFPGGLAATNRLLTYARELGKSYAVKVIVVRPTELEGNVRNKESAGTYHEVDFEYTAGTTLWPQKKGKLTKLLLMLKSYRNLKKRLKEHRPGAVIYVSRSQMLADMLLKWRKRFGYKLFREISELAVMPKGFFRRHRLQRSIALADGHIAMTNEIVQQMNSMNNFNTMLLPMSVDISRFDLSKTRQRGKYFFYCCGATWERDGALDFLKAFEKFCTIVPDYELHMAGRLDPNNSYHTAVKEFIGKSPYKERMKLLGQLPSEQIPELLMSSTAAVMSPAKDYITGGFPTKLGEYLASNVPVICTAVSEIPDYLDCSSAYITTPGNVEKLSEYMVNVTQDPENAALIGANGRKVVEKHFVISAYAEKLAEFLEIKPYKKHIGFLAPTAYNYFHGKGFGGAELQIKQLSKMFYSAGYKVTVLTNERNQPRKEFADGVHLEYAPLRFFGGSNLYFFGDTVRFVRQMRKLDLDWCFFKNPNAALYQLAWARKFARKLRIVKIFASDDDARPGNSLQSRLYKRGVRSTDKFVFQTHVQQDMAAENLQISGKVIPNIFTPPTLPDGFDGSKDIDILWVGAFNSFKCPEKLLKIAKLLPQYRFCVISKPVSSEYQTLLDELKSLPNVEFVGTVPFEKTPEYFARAKVYLCTSAVEGFPNTFLQAWHARACVVSVTFPCDGVLQKYNAGVLAHTEENAAVAIVELLSSEARRGELCECAFEYLSKNHTPEQTLVKFEELINE